ncbi:MAG: hypothetical protein JWN43_4604 [Gammaproteobacteria bacterium]|nr:hypothetical protein [Gammaproteobacteria bacterium]
MDYLSESAEIDFLYGPSMESVYKARVMDDGSAAHVATMMKISTPWCAKVGAERQFLLCDQDPQCA